jgi:hypothetical protein
LIEETKETLMGRKQEEGGTPQQKRGATIFLLE